MRRSRTQDGPWLIDTHSNTMSQERREALLTMVHEPLWCLWMEGSWSPDGGVICATNATQKTRHLAAMIRRGEGWTSETSLVGHERPVVASRFCPAIFRKKDSGPCSSSQHETVLSVRAGQG